MNRNDDRSADKATEENNSGAVQVAEGAFTVCEAGEGRGQGVLAARDIEPGEVVMRAKPLMVCKKEGMVFGTLLNLAQGEFDELSHEDQCKVMELADVIHETGQWPIKTAAGVCATNSFKGGVLFPAPISRINHSCRPNMCDRIVGDTLSCYPALQSHLSAAERRPGSQQL